MRTDDLINALVADLTVSKLRFRRIFIAAIVLGSMIAAIVFFSGIGLRPDIRPAFESVRFLAKLAISLSLAAAAIGLLSRIARPGVSAGPWAAALTAAPALLAVAVAGELAVTPSSAWAPKLIGSNALLCLTFIPLLSAAPLACLIWALRRGAPTSPGLAGLVAGLAASGIGAAFYASHCPDDSPLFVASWYSIATAMVALIGYFAGSRCLRW